MNILLGTNELSGEYLEVIVHDKICKNDVALKAIRA